MVGRTLGQYRVVEKLGAGGMGEVYRATDARLGRDVALKFLPEVFARDPDRLARFEREARLLASLNHPNIAAIHGLEEADGVRFLVLELVEGETLAERLAGGSLPVEEVLSAGRQIAEGLESAHSKGIIHRDLKPANIKITPEGKAKILDFGLAKAFEGEALARDLSQSPTLSDVATRSGVVLGTAAYMSPEQARGKTVDTRTDIWAFGCVLYEALSGRLAFRGDTVSDTVAGILRGEPDWHLLPPQTPASLRRLLRRCLQKDAARRLQHIGDARLELEEALATEPEPSTAVAPPTSWRAVALWCAASFLVGAAVVGLALWPRNGGGPRQKPMQFSVVTNFAGVEAQPALSPDGRSLVFVSNRDGPYDLYVGLVTGGSLVRITNDPNLKVRPRWSPDGSRIAYARLNESGLWDIWVVPALGGTPRRLIASGTDPAWSPDGEQLAYAHAVTGTLWVADATGGNPREVTSSEPTAEHRQPTFSRDGGRLAFVRRGRGPYGELAVVEIGSGKVQELTHDGGLVLSPVWSPDDGYVYFASSRGGTVNIWKIAAAGGEPVPITAGQGADAELDLSADGKRLVFSVYRENQNLAEVGLMKPGGQTLKWLTRDSARSATSPAYSPDGLRIAYFSSRQGAEVETIWVMEADGSDAVQLVDDGHINIYPQWTPDGQGLVYTSRPRGVLSGEAEVRRVPLTGAPPELLGLATASPVSVAAPDGRVLVMDPAGRAGWAEPGTKRVEWVNSACRIYPALIGVARGGSSIACGSRLGEKGEAEAGLWVYPPEGSARQVFRGWVAAFAWVNAEELIVVEGKPDLNGVVWRVWADGRPGARLPLILSIPYTFRTAQPVPRFDAHPDGRRLVISTHQVLEADIGMIENLPQ